MAEKVNLWIVEYSCKRLCDAFAHQDAYGDPERVIDAQFRIITDTLTPSLHFGKREAKWVLLAEFCFRLHKWQFGMATEDSSNSMVFSDLIVDLLKEHGIPDEKMSQLKADFIKIQEVKSKNLKSRTLTRKVDKAYRKLHNEVQMITEGIMSSLGSTFLEMISDIVNSIGPTNRLSLCDILDLMDQYVKDTNILRKDDELEDLDINRKTNQETRGTKKLYNPSQSFPYQSGSSTKEREHGHAVLLERPSSSGTRSSPRLSAKKSEMISDSDETVEVSSQSDVDVSRNRSTRRKRKRLGFSEASPVASQEGGICREEEISGSEKESLEKNGSSMEEEGEGSVENDGSPPTEYEVASTRRSSDNSLSSNDSILNEANLPTSKPRKRRKFSHQEEEWLREGVRRFGVGKWKRIRNAYRFNERTTVNLKDKWRNLVKSGLT